MGNDTPRTMERSGPAQKMLGVSSHPSCQPGILGMQRYARIEEGQLRDEF